MKRLSLLLVLASIPAAASAAPADHPLIQPYEGSVLSRREDLGHSKYKLVNALDASGKTDDTAMRSIPLTGNLTRLFYENPKRRSVVEILANYQEGLEKAGFTILFSCADKTCGPGWASSRWRRVNGMKYVGSHMGYLAAQREGAAVAISVIKARHEIDVLESKEMERGKVTVTAAAIDRGLAGEGRAVLDGLYFDHDKATLKPESDPAIGVIAEYLRAHPKLEVYIVGHTDSAGAFDYNLKLSLERARSVVDVLVKQHQIKAARLVAHGVGPLSPKRSNGSDAGKSENRRVEMVAR